MTKNLFSVAVSVHDICCRFIIATFFLLLCLFYSYGTASAQDAPVDIPIAAAGPDVFTDFGAIVRLDGSASISPDGLPLNYVWTETASGTVIGDGPVIAYTVIDGGFTDLTLSVSYDDGIVVMDEITVSTQSVVPIANAGQDRTVTLGETIRLDGSRSQDQTGAELNYVWTLVEAPEDSTASLNDANAVQPTFTPDLEGLYAFDLNVANENGRLSEPSRLTLSTSNSSPTAFAGSDRLVRLGETVLFDPQGTIDPDGDALTANWTLIHAPTGSAANLEETEGGRQALIPDLSGSYVVQLEITDSMGTSYDHVVVFADASEVVNVPPVANAGQNIALIGTAPILLDGSQSSDVDGDRLEYSWAVLSSPTLGETRLENADQPAATLTPAGAGTYVVQLTVKDGFGGVDRDIMLVTTDALSAQALSGDDAAIIDDATAVDSSASAELNAAGTAYNWSALGLTGPVANIASPDQLTTDVTFERQGEGVLSHPKSALGLKVLQKYSLFTTYDHYAKARVQGRAAIGGRSKGGYSRYGTGLGDTTGTDVLTVQNGIYWGWRKAHGGGNIRTGGGVRARTYLHHPGRLIYDRHLELWDETEAVRKLSHELAHLPATSDYDWVGPRSHKTISLPAVPDASGVAVFHFENAASLLSNHAVRKIKLEANDADTIIINVANSHVGVYKPHLIGDFLDNDIASKVIWNFHEARRLKTYKPLVGSVLAPYAHTSMYAPVKGSVAVETLSQYADIYLPVLKGDGLAPMENEDPVKLSLLQLAASNDSGFAPGYATTLVTTGNLRPLGVLTSSTPNGGSVEPGETVLFDSALSRDDGQAALQRQWSILRAPEGAALPEGEALSAVSLELTPELSGDYIVQLITTDGELASKPRTYRIRIENEPPVANAGEDQSLLKGNLIALDGTASSDPEGNSLSYVWTLVTAPENSAAALVNAETATPSFTPEIPGVYEIALIVSDGVLVSEVDTLKISVENRIPVAVATGMTDGFAGDIIMVSGQQSTDADGDALTYTWSISGPEGSAAQFADPFIIAPSFTPDLAGVYKLSLVVFDGFAESEPTTLIVDVSDANRPPVLDPIGNKSVALGTTLSFQISAQDTDGDNVSYGISSLPLAPGAFFDVNSGVFSFTPRSLTPGTISYTFSATDGALRDRETIQISVTNNAESLTTQYSGQIVDGNSGGSVEGVLVMASGQSAVTDGEGRFTLTDLPAGNIVLWIVSNNATQTSPDGTPYAATQVSATLYSNVNNQAAEPIRLSTVVGTEIILPEEAVTVSSSAFGVTLNIPANALTDMLTGQPYSGPVSISSLSPEQANTLPPNIVPCQLFSIEPKTLVVSGVVTLTLQNYDNLPAGAMVDVWVFENGLFNKKGVGTVNADATRVEASLSNIAGGALIALAPKPAKVSVSLDQPQSTYVPSLLGEGNFSTALSLPGYSSNGSHRGLSFVYNSTAAAPSPIVNTELVVGDDVPASLSSSIEIGGVNYGARESVSTTGPASNVAAGDAVRQAVQIDASNLPVGLNSYNFISTSEYACTRVGQVTEGKVFVDNQIDSPFGSGWSLGELTRLYPQEDGTALIREGNGTLKSFAPQTDFSTLGDPVRLPAQGPFTGELADLDGDGDEDVIWILPEMRGLAVYENLGGREFVQRTVLTTGTVVDVPAVGLFNPDIIQIAIGDFDADGRPDIATANQISDQVNVFYNESGFTFSSEIRISNLEVNAIVAGDFDGNGIDDIVAFPTRAQRPDYYAGSTTRELRRFRLSGNSARALDATVGDYNNDGLPDIATRSATGLALWKAQAGQTLTRDINVTTSVFERSGSALELADMDGDGQVEIVFSSPTNGIRVLTVDPDTRIVRAGANAIIPGDTASGRIFSTGDVNNDGLQDIITTRGNDLVTFFGQVDGFISEPEIVPLGIPLQDPRLADLDGDSGLDVVIDSSAEDELFVFFSDPTRTSKFIDPLSDYTELTRNDDGTYARRFNDGAVISYSAAGLQTSTADSNGNVTSYAYDDEDRLILITDPVGLETVFIYGGNGKLTEIAYPDGRTARWTYSAAGTLIRHVNVNGDVNTFGYDPQDRITTRTDARGLTSEVLYGPAGRYSGSVLPDGTELKLQIARTLGLPELNGGTFTPGSATTTTVQDGRGNLTETMTNDFGSPIQVTDPLGRITRYERDADNNVIAIDAPSSVTGDQRLRTEIDYDAQGNVIAKREAVGTSQEREMTYAYEPEFNKMVSMTDYDGFETIRTYDEFGNMLTETDPLGGVFSMAYEARGLPISRTDKNGNETQLLYNLSGLPVRMTDPSGTVTEYSYDDAGNLLTQIDDFGGPQQREMSYTYDEKNRILTETAADGGVTTYAYDGNDNVISTTDPTGIVETRSYDDRDRLETINDPASGTTVFTYDEDSNILRMTDALSETTEFTYDAVDRLLSSIDAKGQLRAFAYDSRDNITAVTDARANITFMGYDELDRPIARTNPKGEQWNFAYDARDNRISATKPDGVVLTSDYDALSRLTRIAGGDIERTYAYDPQSNLLAANDNLNGAPGPDLGFTYDGENRLETASVTNLFGGGAQNNVFTYGYDALDRRASMSDSFGGNTAYAYDPVDRLTQVTTPQDEVFTQSYDLAGRMLGRIAPNTTATDRSYEDGTGRLMSQTQAASDTAFNGFTYDYTERGNIAEIAETGTLARTKRYSYDELERLTEVAIPEAPAEDESYTLDPEGNRLSSHLSDTGETDVANRLTGDDAYSYVYDLNGNLISKTAKLGVNRPDWTYDYDDLDQLISVSRDGVEVERYRYDALARRSIIETVSDDINVSTAELVRTAIVNEGSNRTIDLVKDVDDETRILRRFTHSQQVDAPMSFEAYAANGIFAQSYSYHADHLGSIRFATDSLGQIGNSYEYDSYGRPGFTLETVAQPFRFTGREYDFVTELYHYRARAYDPETGRFLQEDPIGFGAGDLNLQRYVSSNPLRYTDPSGLTQTLSYSTTTRAGAATGVGARIGAALKTGGATLANALKNPTLGSAARLGGTVNCKFFSIAAVVGGGSMANCGEDSPTQEVESEALVATGSPGGGGCSDTRKKQLQDQKNDACGQPRSCLKGRRNRTVIDDFDIIARNIANGEACLIARMKIMNECFFGGDKAHQTELENVRATLNICRGAL